MTWSRAARWLPAIYAATVVAIVVHQSMTRVDPNFAIFRASFRHLASSHDLYAAYPAEQVDRFKYSPTFALLFAPFALLPTTIALVAWDGLNVMLLVYAIRRLLPAAAASLALTLVYLDVVRATERAQSNTLVAALMVLAFIALERQRQVRGAVSIAAGTAVKLFPIAAVTLAIFHPRRFRMALILLGVSLVALALPLLVSTPSALAAQYASWFRLESIDARASAEGGGAGLYGGIMYQVRALLGVTWPNWPIQLVGTVLLLVPLARVRSWSDAQFRLRFLCSLLVFVVIFNHQVESPSFVIAVTGIAIWYTRSARTPLDMALIVVTLLIVSVSSTEIVPHWIQRDVFVRYRLKTIPCAIVWLVMQAELLGFRRVPPSGNRAEMGEADVTLVQTVADER